MPGHAGSKKPRRRAEGRRGWGTGLGAGAAEKVRAGGGGVDWQRGRRSRCEGGAAVAATAGTIVALRADGVGGGGREGGEGEREGRRGVGGVEGRRLLLQLSTQLLREALPARPW